MIPSGSGVAAQAVSQIAKHGSVKKGRRAMFSLAKSDTI
jgi:hypothetical protein